MDSHSESVLEEADVFHSFVEDDECVCEHLSLCRVVHVCVGK